MHRKFDQMSVLCKPAFLLVVFGHGRIAKRRVRLDAHEPFIYIEESINRKIPLNQVVIARHKGIPGFHKRQV